MSIGKLSRKSVEKKMFEWFADIKAEVFEYLAEILKLCCQHCTFSFRKKFFRKMLFPRKYIIFQKKIENLSRGTIWWKAVNFEKVVLFLQTQIMSKKISVICRIVFDRVVKTASYMSSGNFWGVAFFLWKKMFFFSILHIELNIFGNFVKKN